MIFQYSTHCSILDRGVFHLCCFRSQTPSTKLASSKACQVLEGPPSLRRAEMEGSLMVCSCSSTSPHASDVFAKWFFAKQHLYTRATAWTCLWHLHDDLVSTCCPEPGGWHVKKINDKPVGKIRVLQRSFAFLALSILKTSNQKHFACPFAGQVANFRQRLKQGTSLSFQARRLFLIVNDQFWCFKQWVHQSKGSCDWWPLIGSCHGRWVHVSDRCTSY